MSQPHHMKRFGVDGESQKEGETTKRKKKNLTLKTKRQREKEFHSETTNEFKRRRRSKREEEDEKSDEEDESMRFKHSMSQFASQQNQQKKVEVICEVCGNSGLENFEEDQKTGSYFCKKCNAKTDALVVAPDAEALARALPGFGGEQGPMSFHGARRRRVGFGHRVHDYSQQFTKEERMMEEKRALRIEERKFTKMVDLHCETMTKLLRAQCEFCVERYVESSSYGDKDEEEREKRRREKRANEFRRRVARFGLHC